MPPSSPPPAWEILRQKSHSSKGSSPAVPEEVDELRASRSPTPSYLGLSLAQAVSVHPPYRKQPMQPSAVKRPFSSATTSNREHQPLFLPDSDEEQGPSTSMGAPPSLPEEGEGERPRRKKRRISTKATQSRTLDDLWGARQTSHNQQNSSPSPPASSNLQSIPAPSSQRYKKQGLHSRLGRKPVSKGKAPVQGPSLTYNTQTSHHIPLPKEIIEISDSDEPDSFRYTGMNQALSKSSVSSLATGPEVIEIMSSDAEDHSQPSYSPLTQAPPLPPISHEQPGGLGQTAHVGRSPDLPDLTPIPPRGSSPPSPHEVSSPHEVEDMMDVDDTIQHSPPSPAPAPPAPPLSLQISQVDLDAIERTLSNVVVSSSPTHQAHPPHPSESVEDSEPEKGSFSEDNHTMDAPQGTLVPSVEGAIVQHTGSDDDFHPPPPSSSPPSHHMPPSRQLTPTHIQATSLQNTILSPQTSAEIPLPSAPNTATPSIPDPPHGTVPIQVPITPNTIDLTVDSDGDDNHIPNIDHTTTLRANILRGFFDRSQTRSPAKPGPVSHSLLQPPQGSSPFLDMIRSQRGFPVITLPPQDVEAQEEDINRVEEEAASYKTQESSMADAETHSHCITMAKLTKKDSGTLTSTSGIAINDLIPSPTYSSLSNLPTGLLDYLNNLPDSIRKSLVFRRMFEATIAENTAQDEPGAPPIAVINEIDDEPTPPWEFYYSNKLWYHEDVPPPDYDKLVGCDCVGECDPASATCVCLRRQKSLWPDGMQSGFGFSYDENGILKNWDETIVECNDLCQCTNKCRNRVVQKGRKVRVNIVKTEEKGWGVFAGESMEAGTFLGTYAGELITEAIGESRKIYDEYGRTYLFDLQGNNYVVDAFHIGNFTRFLNHSCAPNCWVGNVVINEHTKRKCTLALFTLEPVEENQELHFSYFGSLDGATRIEAREDVVNGKCYCGAPNCIGTLFPRIIRDDPESGDEGGNEAEAQGDERQGEAGEEAGGMADKGPETGAMGL